MDIYSIIMIIVGTIGLLGALWFAFETIRTRREVLNIIATRRADSKARESIDEFVGTLHEESSASDVERSQFKARELYWKGQLQAMTGEIAALRQKLRQSSYGTPYSDGGFPYQASGRAFETPMASLMSEPSSSVYVSGFGSMKEPDSIFGHGDWREHFTDMRSDLMWGRRGYVHQPIGNFSDDSARSAERKSRKTRPTIQILEQPESASVATDDSPVEDNQPRLQVVQ